MLKKKMSLTIIVIVVVIIAAFYGGVKYGQTKDLANKMAAGNFTGMPGQGNFQGQRGNRNMAGAGFVTGEIVSKDDQSLTIKSRDGGSKVVLYSPTTEISKFVSGSLADLEIGKSVTINGKTNSDGSLIAQTIQMRPPMPLGANSSSTTQATPINPATPVKTFTITAANFSFDLKEIRAKKGDTIKIVLNNQEGTHDWVIDEFNAKTKRLQAGQTDTIQFTADKTGTFEYYCSVGTHRQMGMKGNLIIE